jgi:Zn-dependent peptidase ImmA (M78 family)/transcriptional regulator with XRE-family HTH domain
MAQQTIATNLARLRTDRGLSQAELAAKAGLSRLTLGKIERGEVMPRSGTLSDLAEGLRVDLGQLVTPVRPLPGVRFRAAKRANSREQILAEVSAWLHAYNELEAELGERREFALRNLIGADSDPVRLAATARQLLGLSEVELIRDVCGLLEDHGVKVNLMVRATNAFFGLSVNAEGEGPAVVVNTWERISVERWIFTAAHELGHILLHRDAYDRARDEEVVQEEKDADRFASYFLMPERAFASEWEGALGLRLLDRVIKIKRIFRVSYKTVLHRAVDTGREPASAWKSFQAQHKVRFGHALRKVDEPARLKEGEFRLDWNRAGEPDALSAYDFKEDRLKRLVRLALDRELISLGRGAEILGLSRFEMRELAAAWVR